MFDLIYAKLEVNVLIRISICGEDYNTVVYRKEVKTTHETRGDQTQSQLDALELRFGEAEETSQGSRNKNRLECERRWRSERDWERGEW